MWNYEDKAEAEPLITRMEVNVGPKMAPEESWSQRRSALGDKTRKCKWASKRLLMHAQAAKATP